MKYLISLLRRLAALLALALGLLVAASFALLMLVAATSIAIALWLATRLGMRRVPGGRAGAGAPRGSPQVIDVEMREIDPDAAEVAARRTPKEPDSASR